MGLGQAPDPTDAGFALDVRDHCGQNGLRQVMTWASNSGRTIEAQAPSPTPRSRSTEAGDGHCHPGAAASALVVKRQDRQESTRLSDPERIVCCASTDLLETKHCDFCISFSSTEESGSACKAVVHSDCLRSVCLSFTAHPIPDVSGPTAQVFVFYVDQCNCCCAWCWCGGCHDARPCSGRVVDGLMSAT